MNIHEYQARDLFEQFGVATSKGQVATTPDEAAQIAAGITGKIVVKAQVPLSELEGYAAELKSVTAGRGRYSLDFSHYEPVPANVQNKLVEAYKPRHEED